MKYTQNLNMKIPEGGDPIDIVDITENFETLDIEINKKANTSGGDISDTTIKTVDAIATEFPVPSAGESSKTFLGKIRKFIQDFIAIKDTLLTLSKLVNNGQTTASGFALDARYGKTLADQITKLNTDLTLKADKSELNKKVTGSLDQIANVTFGRTSNRIYIRFTLSETSFYQIELYDDGPLVFGRSINGTWATMWTK